MFNDQMEANRSTLEVLEDIPRSQRAKVWRNIMGEHLIWVLDTHFRSIIFFVKLKLSVSILYRYTPAGTE